MSQAELFESMDIEMINDWITEQKEETVNLDFKRVEKSSMGRPDRKNLAKALSGFSNSEGGIIVWGVDARVNNDGVDCAVRIVSIENVAMFLSKLNEFTSEVSPSVTGVLHRSISVGSESQGIAVTMIPESDSGPHMAKAGLDQYYKRAGDKFIKMEHFDVADMFGRRKQPRLYLQLLPGMHHAHDVSLFLVRLINDGRGSAIAPSIRLSSTPHSVTAFRYGVDGNGNKGMRSLMVAGGMELSYGGNANDVVHPGAYIDIDHIQIPNAMVEQVVSGSQEIIISAHIGAIDSQSVQYTYLLSELMHVIDEQS